MSKRILVTGGAGFIGSHVVEALAARGDNVTILDALRPPVHASAAWPGYTLGPRMRRIEGDVRDPRTWADALKDVDRVIHGAAYQDYRPDYGRYFEVNTVGTALLFEAIRDTGAGMARVVAISTQAVYGEGRYHCDTHGAVFPGARLTEALERAEWRMSCPVCRSAVTVEPTAESDPCRPISPYGLSKYAGELAALGLGRMLGVPTVAARLSITIGPRQSPMNLYSGALRSFAVALMRGDPVHVFEDGEQVRDFTSVGDVVRALLLLVDDDRCTWQAVNVGSGAPVSVISLLSLVERAVGSTASSIASGNCRVGDTRDIVSDITLLRSLGWHRHDDLESVVAGYVEWLRDTGLWREVRPASIAELRQDGGVRAVRS